MIRNAIVLLFFLFPALLFSQSKGGFSPFQDRIKTSTKSLSENEVFDQITSFFLKEEWDSTLVYSTKILEQKLGQEYQDFSAFFRGYSFLRKRLFKEAESEFDKVNSNFILYNDVDMCLGEAALEQNQFEKALKYFQKLDSLQKISDLGFIKGSIENNIGLCYLHQGNYKKAEPYFLKNVQIQESVSSDVSTLVTAYGNLANSYYEQYKDNLAIENFLKAYQLAKSTKKFVNKNDKFFHRQNTAKNMSVVEENRKDYAKALFYRKEAQQWKDSLNDQNRIYETAQLEKKIAVEQKEKEVKVLEAENKAQEAENRVYLFSGILLAILLVILFYSYKGTKKRNQIITTQKEDLDILNATKDKLFSIVSHDLRSSVNAIKTSNKKLLGNLDTQNKEEISQNLQQNSAIVNGAYGLLDNLLNWAMLQTQQTYFEMTQLSLSRIVDHVAYNYQPILEDRQIEYANLVSRKTQVFADQESLKIILRNLLDNAIKFSKEKGKINIYTYDSSDEYVHLVIEDSGLGMDAETRKELLKDTQLLSKKKHEDILGTGLGLHLVKSMIAKNQGMFDIESEEEKGTKMIISLLRSQES